MPDAYEKLKSPCARFISILRPEEPARFAKPEMPSLIFGYEYMTDLSGARPKCICRWCSSVKERKSGTCRRRTFASAAGQWIIRIPPGQGKVVRNFVELPKDLPPGRYHVFLQLSDGDKVISTGHYFSADL